MHQAVSVVPVAAFKDNYVWTLRNASHAAVVDPGEAKPVLDYLKRERLALAADPLQLPLASQSVDLLALPHVLEFHEHPHDLSLIHI